MDGSIASSGGIMNTSFLWAIAISVGGAAGIFLGIKRMRTKSSSIGTNPLEISTADSRSSAGDTR